MSGRWREPLVAIDGRGYFTGGGIGRYTRNLVRELAARRPDGLALRLLISNLHAPSDLDLPRDHDIDVVVSRAGWMNAGEEDQWLENEVADADLFHSLSGHWLPAGLTSVATLHDLTPVVRPDLFAAEGRAFGETVLRAVTRASHVIADSHATALDARRLAPRVPPISVVPAAADVVFTPCAPDAALFERYQVARDDFMLTVSVLNPHKNLARLVESYAGSGVDAPLIVVGAHRDATSLVQQAIEPPRLRGRVRLVGHVTDEDLAGLYSSCRAFVYPSLYEGFGLPVLEAMACGAAVIASCSSSIPEVAGDAALLVDPTQVDSLSSVLRRLDTDASLRRELRRRACLRAAAFSWVRTAASTQAIYTDLVEGRAV